MAANSNESMNQMTVNKTIVGYFSSHFLSVTEDGAGLLPIVTSDQLPVVPENIEFQKAVRYLYVYCVPVLAIVGMALNMTAIVLISSRRLHKLSLAHYVKGVLITDSIYLAWLFHGWLAEVHGFDGLSRVDVSCNFDTFIEGAARFLSVWITVALVVERTIVELWPHRRRKTCTVMRARAVIIGLTTIAIVVNLNTSLTVGYVTNEPKRYCISLSSFGRVARYIDNAYIIVNCIVPMSLLFCCFVLVIICHLRRRMRDEYSDAPAASTSVIEARSHHSSEADCRGVCRTPQRSCHCHHAVAAMTTTTTTSSTATTIRIDGDDADVHNVCDGKTTFFYVFVVTYVLLNLPLCVVKSTHGFKSIVWPNNEPSLDDFLQEQIVLQFHYLKLASNLFVLLSFATFRQSVRMTARTLQQTLFRLQRLRSHEDYTDDDEEEEETSASAVGSKHHMNMTTSAIGSKHYVNTSASLVGSRNHINNIELKSNIQEQEQML